MRVFALIPALALGACTSFGAPRPADVTLSQTHLTVRMSNGERCIGPRPAGEAGGWSGRFTDCSARYDYNVAIQPGANPVRMVFSEALTALGLQSALVPAADVTISDGSGRTWRYVTPERIDN